MDPPTEDDILDQYQYNGSSRSRSRSSGSSFGSGSGSGSESSSAIMQFSDLKKGWKNQHNTNDYSLLVTEQNENNANNNDAELEAYIKSMESRRYNRIMEPSVLPQGTDVRIYPTPRRFPSCAEFAIHIQYDFMMMMMTTILKS
jgi:hypothetical protein